MLNEWAKYGKRSKLAGILNGQGDASESNVTWGTLNIALAHTISYDLFLA